jgi:hypothetical protein
MMPKSHEYLTTTLSAFQMRGYTKVAENTLPNVLPFLSGKLEDEFRNHPCIQNPNDKSSVHLDSCKFIWNKFALNGYRTSFAGDYVEYNLLNKHWPFAFKKPPTDYYMRPFISYMEHNQVAKIN